MEAADDAVVFLNLGEGLQVDVGDAGGLWLQGEQQGQVLLPEAGAADFPHAFADGRDAVQQAVIVAEGAGSVAAVCFPDGGKAAAQQAAAASGGEPVFRPDKQGAGGQVRGPRNAFRMSGNHGFQARNGPEHLRPAGLHGRLNLGEGGQRDLLLAASRGLLLRQGGKETEPVQGILFGDLHGAAPFLNVSKLLQKS